MEDTEVLEWRENSSVLFGLIFIIIAAGLVLAPDLFWDDFIKEYIWDPIVKDAGLLGMLVIRK